MEYIQGIPSQLRLFFLSLGLGFLLGVVYDIFRAFRLLISRGTMFTVFMDILYFVFCGGVIFVFDLVEDYGSMRFFTFAGEALGWLIYYFTFGSVAMRFTSRLILLRNKTAKFMKKAIKFLFRKIKHTTAPKRKKI